MCIRDRIRAEEWITSTPFHILILRAFGWEEPVWCHTPLLRNPDKSKLSKRKMDTSVDSYKAQGFLPEALLNYLGTMAWSMPDGREIFSLQDMIEHFRLERISLGGPVFDLNKLRWMNGKYIREVLTLDDLAERVKPFLERAGLSYPSETYLRQVIEAMRARFETLQGCPKAPSPCSSPLPRPGASRPPRSCSHCGPPSPGASRPPVCSTSWPCWANSACSGGSSGL
jgi:glutamyl-tRNA synthetase